MDRLWNVDGNQSTIQERFKNMQYFSFELYVATTSDWRGSQPIMLFLESRVLTMRELVPTEDPTDH